RRLMVQIHAKGRTDIGSVRSVNQDNLLVSGDESLFIVADGMGGHAGGEIASGLAIECIKDYLARYSSVFDGGASKSHPDGKITYTLASAINFASTRIYERALEEPSLKGMGTTTTVLKFFDRYAYCAHVGDSRLYLYRCGFIYQLSEDHSLVSEQLK